MKGHLATLETGTDATAGAGLLTLMASPGGLSETGAFATAKTLAAMLGTRIRREIMEIHFN